MTLRLTMAEAVALAEEAARTRDPVLLQRRHHAYCATDTLGTRRVRDRLLPMLSEAARTAYGFRMACQRAACTMGWRGILVDQRARNDVLAELDRDIESELAKCAAMVAAIWDGTKKETGACSKSKRKDGKHTWSSAQAVTDQEASTATADVEATRFCVQCGSPRIRPCAFNANSESQVSHLLYDILGIPAHRNKKRAVSVDKDTLPRVKKKVDDRREAWAKRLPEWVSDLIGNEPDPSADIEGRGIFYVREMSTRRGHVKAKLSAAGRYHFSMSIGATKYGRASASALKSPQGQLGGNIQAKAPRDRRMFVADPGFEMGNFDYSQSQSWLVAYRADDPQFIEALKTGDVHTVNCRILFPDLPWTGDIKRDKKIAEGSNPPWSPAEGQTWRKTTKAVSYGWPFGMTAAGAARYAHVTEKVAEEAFEKLRLEYPGVETNFHGYIRDCVENMRPIVDPFGFEIPLMGRPWDHATFREGCSAYAQSDANLTWLACLRIFDDLDPDLVQVLQNGHDSLLCQWRIGHREEVVPMIVERMLIPLNILGRECIIPVECGVGLNWGKYNAKTNRNGLQDYQL